MTNIVPANVKQSLEHFRDRLSRTLERWMPYRHRRNGQVTVVDDYNLPAGIWDRFGPALDVEEDDNEIRVTAELPGLDPDDFKVEIMDNRLYLRGEKKTSRTDKRRGYRYSESRYGYFSRVVPLPAEVDSDKATASFKHGLLRMKLPKTEAAKARRVRVKVA